MLVYHIRVIFQSAKQLTKHDYNVGPPSYKLVYNPQ